MTAATTIPTTITRERIEALILDALADGHVHAWSEIRKDLPGTPWQQVRAAVELSDRGAIDSTKGYDHDPETYMALPLMAA